jgi:N4-gp56 family major capsid protein
MANSVSVDALRPELWQKELYKDVMDNLYFSKFMGEGENNIVQIKSQLKKSKGDQVTIPLTAKLTGSGVTGDSELEGNEEAINAYSDAIAIDQIRNAVRLTGKLDEQKNAYDMRMDAKNKLSIWAQEFIERQFFLKLGGVNNTTITDVNGTTVGTRATWSNAPDRVPNDDTGNGYGDRYLCADYTSGADSLASTDLITPELISRARVKAKLASPMVKPLRIEGKDYYVMWVHPWQAYDLKNNATYAQAQREAQVRGDSNPIFTGALGVWDGVVVHEHEYVPFLDISAVGNNFFAAGAGTDIGADCFRAVLCGQQALGFVQTQDSFMMNEKTFDYGNKVGYATSLIGGIQKVTFNSKDYGVIAVDTAATSLV